MRKIRLDDSCLNHLTNIPVGFTHKSSYIHNSEKSHRLPKILCISLTGGAYAPDATCIAMPLHRCKYWNTWNIFQPWREHSPMSPTSVYTRLVEDTCNMNSIYSWTVITVVLVHCVSLHREQSRKTASVIYVICHYLTNIQCAHVLFGDYKRGHWK